VLQGYKLILTFFHQEKNVFTYYSSPLSLFEKKVWTNTDKKTWTNNVMVIVMN
jgi:hypothetical protein